PGLRPLPPAALAVIGLMGWPMSRRGLAAGYPLSGWNRSADKGAPLVELGARATPRPADLCSDAEIVMLCLADTAAVRDVVFGEGGIVEGARVGQLLVALSSLELAANREMSAVW